MQTALTREATKEREARVKPDFVRIVSFAILLSLSAYVTYIYSLYWTLARLHPYAIEYEGHVFWACLNLAQGANIYALSALGADPHSVVMYNPLYFVIGAGLLKVFGTGFAPLRMLSMASAIISFLGLARLLQHSKSNTFITILTVVGFASLLPVAHWSTVARVDFLGLALAIWSMERFVSFWLSGDFRSKKLSVSLLLSLLAFFCKQQYFIFMAAMVGFAFAKGEKRLAINYLASWSVVALTIASLIQALTGGYFAHLAFGAGLPWEWETLKLFILPFLFDPKTIVAFFVIFLANSKMAQGLSRDFASEGTPPLTLLPAVLLILSLSLALYTMGVRGAFHNHLLCAEFALFWLAALSLNKLSFRFSVLALLAVIVGIVPMLEFGGDLVYRTDRGPETARTIDLLSSVAAKKPLILSEDPSLAIFAGAKPVLIDATTILNRAEARGEKLRGVLADLDSKAYGAVLINTHDAEEHRGSIWRSQIVEAISKNYRLVGKSGGNGMRQSVFLPKP